MQAFSFYDTTVAVINAHLPPASAYPGSASRSALEEREEHIGQMLRELRVGACHGKWDSFLQYHHGERKEIVCVFF